MNCPLCNKVLSEDVGYWYCDTLVKYSFHYVLNKNIIKGGWYDSLCSFHVVFNKKTFNINIYPDSVVVCINYGFPNINLPKMETPKNMQELNDMCERIEKLLILQ